MRKCKPKICVNCKAEFTPTGMNAKYCDDCRPAMIKKQRDKAYQQSKYKRRDKKYRPKGNKFDEITRKAKELGITYGELQAMRYMESMKA